MVAQVISSPGWNLVFCDNQHCLDMGLDSQMNLGMAHVKQYSDIV